MILLTLLTTIYKHYEFSREKYHATMTKICIEPSLCVKLIILEFLDNPRTFVIEFPRPDYKENKLESPPASLSTESDQQEVLYIAVYAETGRKTLLPSTSLPVMGEIAGVNTVSLGVSLHSTKTKARRAEEFHDELNGHVFDLERDGLRHVVLCPRLIMR